MQTDDRNSSLYRANSKKSDRVAFLSPLKENSLLIRNTSSKAFSNSYTASKLSHVGTPRKSFKIVKPETLKRANNDAWMAAAIGDLEWLKNSLKISTEIVFDKNVNVSHYVIFFDEFRVCFIFKGFATIHLACIHGRLNIMKYLIEDQKLDINLRSSQGWCPLHLCINNQIGAKAVECLKYLIEQGADINV